VWHINFICVNESSGVLQYCLVLSVFNALMFVLMCQLVHHLLWDCVRVKYSQSRLGRLCKVSVLTFRVSKVIVSVSVSRLMVCES